MYQTYLSQAISTLRSCRRPQLADRIGPMCRALRIRSSRGRVTSLLFFIFLYIMPLATCHNINNSFFFFLNDPAPPEIYPLSLHDPLPISFPPRLGLLRCRRVDLRLGPGIKRGRARVVDQAHDRDWRPGSPRPADGELPITIVGLI